VAALPQHRVELLRGVETLHLVQQGGHGRPLSGVAHRRPGRGHGAITSSGVSTGTARGLAWAAVVPPGSGLAWGTGDSAWSRVSPVWLIASATMWATCSSTRA